MLIHHIDHPIAKSPQEKERADKEEGYEMVTAIRRLEKEGFHRFLIEGLV
jgi:hypothetical protein